MDAFLCTRLFGKEVKRKTFHQTIKYPVPLFFVDSFIAFLGVFLPASCCTGSPALVVQKPKAARKYCPETTTQCISLKQMHAPTHYPRHLFICFLSPVPLAAQLASLAACEQA
jgi:hypothetical protein